MNKIKVDANVGDMVVIHWHKEGEETVIEIRTAAQKFKTVMRNTEKIIGPEPD